MSGPNLFNLSSKTFLSFVKEKVAKLLVSLNHIVKPLSSSIKHLHLYQHLSLHEYFQLYVVYCAVYAIHYMLCVIYHVLFVAFYVIHI